MDRREEYYQDLLNQHLTYPKEKTEIEIKLDILKNNFRRIDREGNVRDYYDNIIMYKGKICPRCLNIGHNKLSCEATHNIYGDKI